MKKYRVYFDQINQTWYEVEANSKEEAEEKTKKLWQEENLYPSIYIEEE